MNRLKIGTRLATCFALVVALMLAIAAISLTRFATTADTISEATRIRQSQLAPLYDIREALAQTGISARNAFIMQDDAEAARELDLVDQFRVVYMERLAALEPVLGSRAEFRKARDGLLRLSKELNRPRMMREAHQMEAFSAFLIKECSPLRREIVIDLDKAIKAIEADMNVASAQVNQVTDRSTNIILAISAVAIVFAAILAFRVSISIVRPITRACEFAQAVERGDLTVQLDSSANDELGVMMRTLQQMRGGLENIVVEVRQGASAITHVTEEIATGNLDLSHRTEAQASSLQQTAASMETLTLTMRNNAATAQTAGKAAAAASSMVFIFCTTASITAPPWAAAEEASLAALPAVCAVVALLRMVVVRVSIEAAVCCSDEAWASVRCDRSRLPVAISSVTWVMALAPWRTSTTIFSRPQRICCRVRIITPSSSFEAESRCTVRSPRSTAWANSQARVIGRTMLTDTAQARKAAQAMAKAEMAIMMTRDWAATVLTCSLATFMSASMTLIALSRSSTIWRRSGLHSLIRKSENACISCASRILRGRAISVDRRSSPSRAFWNSGRVPITGSRAFRRSM